MRLAGMNGFELQRRLMTRPRRMPIVFVSAYDDAVMRANAIRAGAAARLKKPFDANTLLDALDRLIRCGSRTWRDVMAATTHDVPSRRRAGPPRGESRMISALCSPPQPASRAHASSAERGKTSTDDNGLSTFVSVRPRLFGIAYRMLRGAAAAEDLVQDVWVRWQTADRSLVRDPQAFLVTTATRLAINVMQSARSRRETYVRAWLPEPVKTNGDPELEAARGEGLEAGIRLLLEKLSPMERAAYILREAFDYPYRDIAKVLRVEEANARQVITRARQHVANGRRNTANATEQRHLLDAFIAAAQNGDVAGLEMTLCGGCRHVSMLEQLPGGRADVVDLRKSTEAERDRLEEDDRPRAATAQLRREAGSTRPRPSRRNVCNTRSPTAAADGRHIFIHGC
jgi:RNA polymerase sigma factor (sigma-70 family)